MNITNRDYFTFNVDNSALIVGQTGSGKSELVHKLIDSIQSAQSPDEVRFALFDLKYVEFNDTNKDYLYFDVVNDASIGLEKLGMLADISVERAEDTKKQPLLFIYIEECDMAAIDQDRFDKAVITINKNAVEANIKLIYSTSRPSPDVISEKLLNSFDLLVCGPLVNADYSYLGVQKIELNQYQFSITEQKDRKKNQTI